MKATIEIPDGYTLIKVSDTEYKVVKNEKKLPDTWEEFCENYSIKEEEYYIGTGSNIGKFSQIFDRHPDNDRNILPSKEKAEAILALCQLIRLRDCYNDGWVPDWKNDINKPCVILIKDEWKTISYVCHDQLFCFKSESLRDKFLENFRELLDKIKPLYQ